MVASNGAKHGQPGGRGQLLTVLYDGDCGVCTETARALAMLDRRGALRLVPLQSASVPGAPDLDALLEELHAVDENGDWWVGADVFVEIAKRIGLLRPFAVLMRFPPAKSLADVLYRIAASHRHQVSRVLGLNACKRPGHAYGHANSAPSNPEPAAIGHG